MERYLFGQPNPVHFPDSSEGRVTSRKQWTIQEIRAMSAADYAANLTNPSFRAAIDSMGRTPAKLPEPQ